jgi:hypothetical protein
MPSLSLRNWSLVRIKELHQIEHAHKMVGGIHRGRRYATQQINQAYVMLLSSQFQGFCRDLHSECVDHIAGAIHPVAFSQALRAEFSLNRKLSAGNPNPGNIGADFNKFGMELWSAVYGLDARNRGRRALLETVVEWRNAIAHQDFPPAGIQGRTTLQLQQIRSWRRALDMLAAGFDVVLSKHVGGVTGVAPW